MTTVGYVVFYKIHFLKLLTSRDKFVLVDDLKNVKGAT